jgi:uncharacterized protein (DUF1697 family)
VASRSKTGARQTAGTAAYMALLRGINVGGKNIVPMDDLAALFAEAGCSAVRTYIQSGNVVFQARADLARGLPARIAKRIEDHLGIRAPVILRSADALAQAVRDNPFLAEGADVSALHVMFLADEPDRAAIARLDPARSPGDRFAVLGREVFLHLPNGVGRSKLTNDYFDRTLGTSSTIRNWRTVSKLLEMTREPPA